MSTAFIPPVPPRAAENRQGRPAQGLPVLQIGLPTEKSTVDDKLRVEVDVLAHQLLKNLCNTLSEKLTALKPAPQAFVLLDADLRAGLDLLISTTLQLEEAKKGFTAAKQHADEANDWWERNRLKPPANPDEVRGQAADEPAASAPVFSPSGAVSNLLSLAQVQSQFFGRDVTIQDSALYCALSSALLKNPATIPIFGTSIFGPSGIKIDFNLNQVTFMPVAVQTKLIEVMELRGEAALRVDQFARIAALEPKDSPKKPLLASIALRLQDEVAASSALLDAMDGLFGGKPADGKASGLELLLRAAHLLEKLLEAGSAPLFVFAKVEVAGGAYRIVRSLHQLIGGTDGVEFSAGLVLSYAAFDMDGHVKMAGLLDEKSDFRKMEQGDPKKAWGPVVLLLAIMFVLPKLLELAAAFVRK